MNIKNKVKKFLDENDFVLRAIKDEDSVGHPTFITIRTNDKTIEMGVSRSATLPLKLIKFGVPHARRERGKLERCSFELTKNYLKDIDALLSHVKKILLNEKLKGE